MPNALLDLFHKEVLSDWFAMIGGMGMQRGDHREMIRGIAYVWKIREEIVGRFVAMLCEKQRCSKCLWEMHQGDR